VAAGDADAMPIQLLQLERLNHPEMMIEREYNI